MSGIGHLWHVTSRQLMTTLGTGLNPGKGVADGKVDGLIVADLEMQKRVVFQTSPAAAI